MNTKAHTSGNDIEPLQDPVITETNPDMYKMHRFWARKPANVISAYISHYTDEDDIVLDPFCGSGITIGESLVLGRKAVGVDLNPMAKLLSELTVAPLNIDSFNEAYGRIASAVSDEIQELFITQCRNCGKEVYASSFAWQRPREGEAHEIVRVKYQCEDCEHTKLQVVKPIDYDWEKLYKIEEKVIPYYYPKDIPLHETAKRSVDYIHQLFTKRSLIAFSILRNEIMKESDTRLRKFLILAFTSSLAQSSKLNSIDFREGREWMSRGWTVNNYWVPVGFLEDNVWEAFSRRFDGVVKGKTEAHEKVPAVSLANDFDEIAGCEADCLVARDDSTDLSFIPDRTVDYIFTDPPYGSSIPYMGLTLMWGAWLDWTDQMDFENEIVISEKGDYEKELAKYKDMLAEAFEEMFRVLKPGKWLSVTFHNREIAVWNALVTAAAEAGFEYVNDVFQLPAVVSAKAQLARSGSLTGDIVVNFRKPKGKPKGSATSLSIEELIYREARQIIAERKNRATTNQIMRGVVHKLITHGKMLETTKPIEQVLEEHFKRESSSVWTVDEEEESDDSGSILDYIPLNKRLEWIISGVLSDGPKNLDEIVVPVYRRLKNGRTPEREELIDVLERIAVRTGNKWKLSQQMELSLDDYEDAEEQLQAEIGGPTKGEEHDYFIKVLSRLGQKAGYNVWVGKTEQNKNEELRKYSLEELVIPGFDSDLMKIAEQIDVIWLHKRTLPVVLFEIENTTEFVRGIKRMLDLHSSVPHLAVNSFIVTPDAREQRLLADLNSPSMKQQLKGKNLSYILYSTLLNYYEQHEVIDESPTIEGIEAISASTVQ